MAVIIEGESKRIGLALSGGGFRAAAFHLGVFRRLEEAGLLWNVDVLSCVSGGSIAGAFLASRWKQPGALDELERYLKSKSIAVASFIWGLLDPTESRVDKLADSYDRDLFGNATLSSLSAGPRIYLNATNLSTGNLFFFVAGGGKTAELGEHELGHFDAGQVKISRAVAASSSFPPVFNPLKLSREEYPTDRGPEYVTLTDGGVYDNLGVNPMLYETTDLDYAIVSDGGKPFATDDDPTVSGIVVLKESINISMEQVRGLQFDRLKLSYDAKKGPKPLWFSIDSSVGEKSPGDGQLASAVGTNLKKLSEAEIMLLGRHGAALVEHRLRRYAPELLKR